MRQAPAPGTALPFGLVERIPKRRKTSEQVTKMDRRIKTMMIHVKPRCVTHKISIDSFPLIRREMAVAVKFVTNREWEERDQWKGLGQETGNKETVRDILLSAMESDSISARSRKTRQRSFRTWMRGLISRYSRTAW